MSDTATEPENASAGDVEPLEDDAVAESEAEVEVVGGSELEPEPDAAAEPEPEAEPELDAAAETEPEPEAEPDAEPEPEPAPEHEPEPEPAPEPLTLDELVADLQDSEPQPESVEDEPSLEEVVPAAEATEIAQMIEEPAPEAVAAPTEPTALLRRWWTRAPFWTLDGLWVCLTIAMLVVLWRAPAATFADGVPYAVLVLGGAALAFIGLLTGLVVWLVARSRASEDERVGLGLSLWTRALAWTAGGVALWWVGLLVLDLHHAGVIG